MILLSNKENKRAKVLSKVDRGDVTAAEGGEVLGLSVRHVRRLLSKYREEGPKALAHGNRGRKPAHALDVPTRLRIRDLAQSKYAGFNHQHFTEKLEEEGIVVSRSTVRRLLLSSGIKSPRKRRPPKHRRRRERRPQRGMMLQIDGSRHDWLEGRGPYLTLLGAIDDATGEVPYALFREQEDAQGYFLLLEGVVLRCGVPLALYSDRHSVFLHSHKETMSLEEELKGEREPTQFGRLLKELEIEPIYALSPQGKGRVERLWGTFQDRLVSELRLAKAKTLGEAKQVLEKFLIQYNERFVVEPRESGSAYRPSPAKTKLEEVFCFKYERVVANDNTIRLGERYIQIEAGPGKRSYAKAKVKVHEGMDGGVAIYYQGKCVAKEEAPAGVVVLRPHDRRGQKSGADLSGTESGASEVAVEVGGKWSGSRAVHLPPTAHKPAPNHPWNKPLKRPMVTKSLNS